MEECVSASDCEWQMWKEDQARVEMCEKNVWSCGVIEKEPFEGCV
jgi:hypothetical protein